MSIQPRLFGAPQAPGRTLPPLPNNLGLKNRGLGALSGKVWRFGVKGYNAQMPRVERFLGALNDALRAEGWGA